MRNPAAIRLLNQQLAAPLFDDPADVVAHMGAMQAQEYRMMRWAVAMRTRKPSAKAFKTAFDAGRIVRLHLMRGTWQLVSAEDYWTFLDLCAPRAIAVTRGWMRASGCDIPAPELRRVGDLLAQAAADAQSATKEDLLRFLAAKNVRLDPTRFFFHLRLAELAGLLCSGDLLPMKATYAPAAAKIRRQPKLDRDENLARFTRKYFRSRQPATLEDFVWWSGLPAADCRKGIALLENAIHVERHQDRDFHLMDGARTRGFRSGKYLLIPPYDEYLIAYKSRDIAIPPQHRHRAHNNSGIFQPVVARDGIVCGNWSPFRDTCQASFFDGSHDAAALQSAWQTYEKFRQK